MSGPRCLVLIFITGIALVCLGLVACDAGTGDGAKGQECNEDSDCASGACIGYGSSTGDSCMVCGGEPCGTCPGTDICLPGGGGWYCVPFDPCGPKPLIDGGLAGQR